MLLSHHITSYDNGFTKRKNQEQQEQEQEQKQRRRNRGGVKEIWGRAEHAAGSIRETLI